MVKAKKRTGKKRDVKAEVNDRLVKCIENGVIPWRKPWISDPCAGDPCNFITDKEYRGVNFMLCDATAIECGYSSKYWGTYKQWSEKGFQVRKGEKSTEIVYWNWFDKKPANAGDTGENCKGESEEGATERIAFMKTYYVFNAHQVDGEGIEQYLVNPNAEKRKQEWSDIRLAESVASATGCPVRHAGNQAYYQHSTRSITMPAKEKFECAADYYATLFHELGHWSEYESGFSKLDRESRLYALAELYAEVTGCYVCGSLGIPNDLNNSASYLESWLRGLKAKPGLIISVAQWASKGADCVLGKTFEKPAETAKHKEIVKVGA